MAYAVISAMRGRNEPIEIEQEEFDDLGDATMRAEWLENDPRALAVTLEDPSGAVLHSWPTEA